MRIFPKQIAGFIVMMIGLVGCLGPKNHTGDLATIPEAAVCAPVEYKKIEASAQAKPPWILVEPPDSEKIHYLVGMSGYHATERDSREEAMRHARQEFARYTGVEVTEIDEYAKAVYGPSSSILDPTIVEKSLSTQGTDAMVSRTKPREWYLERLRVTCGKKDLGIAYQTWVLAEVPVDEYDEVQEWKAKKRTEELEAKNTRIREVKQDIENVITSHNKAVAEVDRLIVTGDPLSALGILHGDWSRLYDKAKEIEAKGSEFSADLQMLHQSQQEDVSAVSRVRSSLVIDPGRGASLLLPSGHEGAVAIPAWVFYRRDNQVNPAFGINLILKEEGGNTVIGRGRSDPDGKVVFHVKGIRAGNYGIFIDPEKGELASLIPPIQESMKSMGAALSVVTYNPDMEGASKAAVSKLFSGPSLMPPPASKIVMGPVYYGETRFGSEFGKKIQFIIERELTSIPQIRIIQPPASRDPKEVQEAAKIRGIGLGDRPPEPMSSPAMQAHLDGAEAALEASYGIEGDHVDINLRLIRAKTGEIIGVSGAGINKGLIPEGVSLRPPSSGGGLMPVLPGKSNDIHLEITTHRGDRVTFVKGEKIQYLVSSDKDAYLLLLYRDADGNLIQIYPNSRTGDGFHQAGVYFSIPDKDSTFDFAVTPPFGVEEVWAFASTKPFPALKGRRLSDGLTLIEMDLAEAAAKLRLYGRGSGRNYGETNVVITTVKE